MEKYKTDYEKKRERDREAFLKVARSFWETHEWASANQYLEALAIHTRGRSCYRTRQGAHKILNAAGVYIVEGRHAKIDFTEYDKRVSQG